MNKKPVSDCNQEFLLHRYQKANKVQPIATPRETTAAVHCNSPVEKQQTFNPQTLLK